MRILIIEGSAAPPTFVRNLIRGLSNHPDIVVGVLAKESASSALPGIRMLYSDYGRLASLRILLRIARLFAFSPRRALAAVSLTDKERNLKAWIKRYYRVLLITEFDPDVIHFQWSAHLQYYQSLISARKYPVVVSLRGTQVNVLPILDLAVRRVYEIFFPHIYFHAVSHAIGEKAITLGALPSRVNVIYSPVPNFFFQTYSSRGRTDIRPLKILSIGRFEWIKGYSYAIEAIRLIRGQGIDAEYTIIGNGEISSELLYQVKDRGLGDVVTFLSARPQNEIISIMKEHNVLLLPSVEEGIANVVLEAMASGLPVICTDCGGMREVVEHKVTGWLIPIRDPLAMAEALVDFCQTSLEDVSQLRLAAHNRVKSMFDFEENIVLFKQLYTQMSGDSS